jgi:Fe-S-cluster containining protein
VAYRATLAVEMLTKGFPGDSVTGRLTDDEDVLDRFFQRHSSLACPALDPRSRLCELYEWRPVACRTNGPPIRFGDERAPHCRLCFEQASRETLERCRVEPDPEGLEQLILQGMGVAAGKVWETLIAFALARGAG